MLDGRHWQDANDFYDAFFVAVGAPKWHGRSLDALNDSIGAGQINRIETPYTIVVRGYEQMAPRARQFVDRVREVIDSLRREGCEVDFRGE